MKSYSTLIKGARLVVEQCFAVPAGDGVLIIADEAHELEAKAVAAVVVSLGAQLLCRAGLRSGTPQRGIPPGMQGVAANREQAADLVAEGVAEGVDDRVEVVLPTYMPPGFMLAAPYIAVGSGSARPNRQTWVDVYRVSHTDGTALVAVTAGAEEVPEGLDWQTSELSQDGRALRTAFTGSGVAAASVREP